MRERFTDLIRREAAYARAGRPARIVAKMNALEDPAIVAELYRASMAGVDVDLIVRDICRLRPGIEGVSDTVDVYSIVDRFLEHSRIYYFENGANAPDPAEADVDGAPQYYLGSADWMTRNLDNRVEAVAPVTDPSLREQLRFVLEVMCNDNATCWRMQSDGTYEQRTPGDDPVWATQSILMDAARTAHHRDDARGLDTDHPASPGDLLVAPPSGTEDGATDADGTDDGLTDATESDADGTDDVSTASPPADED
jgi:polyphosphate kinase